MPFLIVEQQPKYGRGSASLVRRGHLGITPGVSPISGQVIPLDAEEVVVGRNAEALQAAHPNADVLCLLSVQINRYHARFRRLGGRYVLEDMRSRNGLYVNGVRVGVVDLNDWDRIRIMEFEFVFREEGTESLDTSATLPT